MKKRNKNRIYLLICLLIMFGIFGAAWCLQIKIEKNHEQENIDMVYQMLGELQNGLSYEQVAANIMKGNVNQKAVEEGLLALMEYGYGEDYESIFSERTKAYAKSLAVFYLMLYVFFLALFYSIWKCGKKRREMELQKLGKILEKFYNGEYDFLAENFGEETESLLYMQLESLGQKLTWNEERLETEKEETKALVTDLSHQLKTPVASIKMCFSLLKDEDLKPEERKEFLNRLGEQITHLEGLLAALINISRMEMGMIEIHKEKANIFNTVVQAVNQVYMKAEEKRIEIVIDSQSPEIEALFLPHDVKWTKEAIVNVLENAIKYSPADSRIQIMLEKQIHFLRLEIKDEGIGIKKEEINRIFQRFYRGKHEIVKQVDGSGVGLYLTRKILEAQGGNIVVVSSLGKRKTKGCTFAIMLSLK